MFVLRVIFIGTLFSWTLLSGQENVTVTEQSEENNLSSDSIDIVSSERSEGSNKDDIPAVPENPFLTNEDAEHAGPDMAPDSTGTEDRTDDGEQNENPFLTGESDTPEKVETDLEKPSFSVILDISRGVSMTRFEVEPTAYKFAESKGGYDFLFDIGALLPIKKWFFTELSFRFIKLKYSLSYSYEIKGISSVQKSSFNTEENISFISAPVDVGLRFDLGRVIPYFYGEFTPAYLTGGHQLVITETETLYPDSTTMTVKVMEDIDITEQRERHQIFMGGGIGMEIYYGYGTVYIDGAFQIACFNPDEENDTKSKPKRKAKRLIFFPISLGLRFYL